MQRSENGTPVRAGPNPKKLRFALTTQIEPLTQHPMWWIVLLPSGHFPLHPRIMKIAALITSLLAGLALGETGDPVGPPGGDGGRFKPGWNGMAR